MQTLLCWGTIAENCSCSSQKIWAVKKFCQRAANPYNCLFSTLWFSTAASFPAIPPSASTFVTDWAGEVPPAVLSTSPGEWHVVPGSTSVTWHKHTSAPGHLMASHQNLWGSPEAVFPGICLPVGSREAQLSHTVGPHISPQAGLGCN